MKKIEQYLVGEHTFSDEKFASKVEPLIEAHPELEFVSDGDELYLPIETWRGETKIFISNDVLELQLITHDPCMSSKQVFELDSKGILWEVSRGVQYFVLKQPSGDLKDDFDSLYKFSEEWK